MAQAARTHSGAPPEQLAGSPCPQQRASGRPRAEDRPPSTNRQERRRYASQIGQRGMALAEMSMCAVIGVGAFARCADYPRRTPD